MQRNFIAKFLTSYDKDAALVAFYGDDPQDWRFSFVKMEYQLSKDEKGNVTVLKELTPARRYSFLVGVNEPNHTARKQLLELLIEEQVFPALEDLEGAFSIEKVTKEFFKEYKELFLELKDVIEKIILKNSDVRHEFEDKCIDVVDFSKRLLGQIVFIYFLQKKGWLGVGKNPETGKFKKWGEGPKDFLRQLFDRKIVPYDNFFNDILEPLFYEALARPRVDEDSYFSNFKCKIPFLNGGLFEPINGYSWHSIDILIDNAIFKRILGIFDTFNFTVKEDEPLEKEVAVDPEMLGKVFENLLEIKDRKSKGTYYTPREIVHYMCQQSLINYLETNSDIDKKDIKRFIHLGDFTVDKDEHLPKPIEQYYQKIDELLKNIKIVDPAVGSGAFPVGMMNEIVKARTALTPLFSEKEQDERINYNLKREAIENSLYGVDIEPSAVDITQLRFWLSLIVDEESIDNIRPLPNLEHKIMCGNSLLEEFEGKKLFDERLLEKPPEDKSYELEQIERERNKLYKEFHDIHTGRKQNNGRAKEIEKELKKLEKRKKKILSEPKNDDLQQMSLHSALNRKIIESQRRLKELKELHSKYFNEQNREKKKQYAEHIEIIEWKFIEESLKEQDSEEALEKLEQYKKYKSKPFFLWKLYFSEIFQQDNPGFDIVIANPPYLGEKNHKEIFREIKISEFGRRFYKRKMDIFYFFFHKALDLAKKEASISFISTNYFITADGALFLRRNFKQDTTLLKIINFNELKIFDSARGQHNMITILRKGVKTDINLMACVTNRSGNATPELLQKILSWNDEATNYYLKSQNQIYDGHNYYIRLSSGKNEDNTSGSFEGILNKIKDNSVPLISLKNVNQGVLTGADKVTPKHIKNKLTVSDKGSGIYVLSDDEVDALNLTVEEKKIIKCYYKNSDIFKYCTRSKEYKRNLVYATRDLDINTLPNIKNHLFKYEQIIKNRSQERGEMQAALKVGKWWVIFATRGGVNFNGPKIVCPQRSPSNIFGYNEEQWFASADVYFITNKTENDEIDIKYILALLNSKLYYVWLYFRGKRKGELLELFYTPLTEIPIKKISFDRQKPLINYVNQILNITKDENYLKDIEKQSKVKELEKEMDKLFYDIYQLTPEEIEIVKDFNKGIEQII